MTRAPPRTETRGVLPATRITRSPAEATRPSPGTRESPIPTIDTRSGLTVVPLAGGNFILRDKITH